MNEPRICAKVTSDIAHNSTFMRLAFEHRKDLPGKSVRCLPPLLCAVPCAVREDVSEAEYPDQIRYYGDRPSGEFTDEQLMNMWNNHFMEDFAIPKYGVNYYFK